MNDPFKSLFAATTTTDKAVVDWLNDFGFGTGRKTSSGENVSPEKSLTLSQYFACIRNISEDVAKIPTELLKVNSDGTHERATELNAYKLLKFRSNPYMSAFTMKETINQWALGWGNGLGEITRDFNDEPNAIFPIHPSRLAGIRIIDGELIYFISIGNTLNKFLGKTVGDTIPIPSRNMLHIHGMGDGITGYSIAQLAAESTGIGLASQKFSASFYGNGVVLSGVIEHPETLSDTAWSHVRKSFKEINQGAGNSWNPEVLEEGMKWKPLGVPPKDAQFIQTRNFQINDAARFFRVPPHKIQHLERSSFSNIEQQNIEYNIDTLSPWFSRWESELNIKLLSKEQQGNYEYEFNESVLLRGDSKSTGELIRSNVTTGVMKINEGRRILKLNPIPEGDVNLVQLSFTTLKNINSSANVKTNGSTNANKPKLSEKSLYKFKYSQLPLFRESFSRLINKESKAVERHKEKFKDSIEEFNSWCDGFFSKQHSYFISEFEMLIEATRIQLMQLAKKENANEAVDIRLFASAYTDQQRNYSISVFNGDKNIEDWNEEYIDRLSINFLDLITNSVLGNL